jgi:AraC-like DNA-binding protein
MKEWVERCGIRFSKERLQKAKTVFDDLKERNPIGISDLESNAKKQILAVSRDLTKEIDYIHRDFTDDFTIMFASVLVDLAEDKFNTLCNTKNVLYILGSDTAAYINVFDLDNDLKEGKQMRIATFCYQVSVGRWLAGRGIIIHELIHIIEGIDNEARVHEIAEEWGFERETTEAKRVYPT